MKKRKLKKTQILTVVIAAEILIILCLVAVRALNVFDKGEEEIITSSTLTEAIDMSELSTAQFTYNGIAEVYKDEKKKKVKCHIRYNATVKAGIDMKDVEFEIDHENLTVKPSLPEIQINVTLVDETSLSFIPADTTVELKEALAACEEDAEREAMESQELKDSAEENLKSIIEALIYPILNPQGYRIIWE